MIGDAAMLVSPEPDAADGCGARPGRRRRRPRGRGSRRCAPGVARGPALARGGDWYGRPVNLASRITAIACPGSVLVSEEVKEAASNGYRWSFAGERRLKGIDGRVKLFRVRRRARMNRRAVLRDSLLATFPFEP